MNHKEVRMEQTELLWQYQQADMAADAFETEIKRNPNRLQLKKNREFLVEQQNAVKRMEQEVAEMLDRVDVIKVAISRMEDQLSALQKRMEATPPADLKQAQDMSRDAQKLLSDLTDYEQEMKRIQKDASTATVWKRNSHQIRQGQGRIRQAEGSLRSRIQGANAPAGGKARSGSGQGQRD